MKKLTLRELFAIAEAKGKQSEIFAKAGKKVALDPEEIDYIKECKSKVEAQIESLLELEFDINDTDNIKKMQQSVKDAKANASLLDQVIEGTEIKRGISQLKAMGTFDFDSIFETKEEIIEEAVVEEETVVVEETDELEVL